MMKLLFENWRQYLNEEKKREFLLERINTLSSNRRFVNDSGEEPPLEEDLRLAKVAFSLLLEAFQCMRLP